MTEYGYETAESFNTALKLTSMVGRLKVASNLKAVGDAQQQAFAQAGRACALIAEAATRDGGGQAAAYRDARGALAQCRAWIHVIAELVNEPMSVFATELDLAEQATKQLNASLRALEMRRDSARDRDRDRDRGPLPPRGGRGPGGPPGRGGPPRGGARGGYA
jgi:hypothetical protein